MDAWEQIAHAAYQAYAKTTDNKNFRGEEMPSFDALPEKIRDAWKSAVRGAVDYAVSIKLNGLAWHAINQNDPAFDTWQDQRGK